MAIITLTSDMGTSDHYVAAVKGAVLSQLKEAVIVDISHHIAPFSNRNAAFVLHGAWPAFPAGTVHMISVNAEAHAQAPHVAVRHQGHYFIGADNGIFHLLFGTQPEAVVALTLRPGEGSPTFPSKGIFAQAACHLAQGGAMDLLGSRREAVQEQFNVQPAVMDGAIKGEVIHVDHYGNVITNITKDLFISVVKHHGFTIAFGPSKHNITTLHNTYADVPPGERVAFFSDSGHLEIAVNKGVVGNGGGAAQLLGLRVADPVRLEVQAVAAKAALPQ